MKNSNMFLKENGKVDSHYAILKKQIENFGSEDIINEFGQIIGKIIIPFFYRNRNLKIHDLIKDEIFALERNKSPFYTILNLKDKSDNLIIKIKKKKSLFLVSKIDIEDNNGMKCYTALGNFKSWNYELITISNDKLIARVKDFDEMNFLAQKLHLNSNKYYSIEFLNQNIDKTLINCIVISINNLTSSNYSLSDVTGFERKIARLRPFGPGKSLN